MNEQYRIRRRELATLLIIANITGKLGVELTRVVNQFRRRLRGAINKIERDENALYLEAKALATRAWGEATDNRKENIPDLSVVMTLGNLNVFVEDTKWIAKKVYTQKNFIQVCASITDDRDTEITVAVEKASNQFINTIAESLGYDLPTNTKLKRMILIMRQNKEIL